MNARTRAPALSLLLLAVGFAPMAAQETGSNPDAGPQATHEADIVMRVDGLACPFCAHGLKQKLEALDATERVEVKLNDGEVLVFLAAGGTVEDELLTKAVRDAGFVVREIRRRTDAAS